MVRIFNAEEEDDGGAQPTCARHIETLHTLLGVSQLLRVQPCREKLNSPPTPLYPQDSGRMQREGHPKARDLDAGMVHSQGALEKTGSEDYSKISLRKIKEKRVRVHSLGEPAAGARAAPHSSGEWGKSDPELWQQRGCVCRDPGAATALCGKAEGHDRDGSDYGCVRGSPALVAGCSVGMGEACPAALGLPFSAGRRGARRWEASGEAGPAVGRLHPPGLCPHGAGGHPGRPPSLGKGSWGRGPQWSPTADSSRRKHLSRWFPCDQPGPLGKGAGT